MKGLDFLINYLLNYDGPSLLSFSFPLPFGRIEDCFLPGVLCPAELRAEAALRLPADLLPRQ